MEAKEKWLESKCVEIEQQDKNIHLVHIRSWENLLQEIGIMPVTAFQDEKEDLLITPLKN